MSSGRQRESVTPFALLFAGLPADIGDMSMPEQYRAAMLRRNLAHGTVTARVNESRRWLAFAGDQWAVADRHLIEQWLDGRPLGARARYTAISHLSAFYRWAIREETPWDTRQTVRAEGDGRGRAPRSS